MLRDLFIHNLDYVYLFCGAAFFLLGTASFIFYLREKPKKKLTLAWDWLACFGFLHGFNEWLDMVALSCRDSSCWSFQRNIILGISFLCLFEFFRRSLLFLKNIRLGPWICLPFVAAAAILTQKCFFCFEPSLRYTLGFPTTLASSYIFWTLHSKGDFKFSKSFSRSVAFLFFLYAISSGLVVPLSHHWLSRFLNNTSFFDYTHFPVQLFRGLVVTIIAFSFFYKMTKTALSVPGIERGLHYVKVTAFSFFLLYIVFLFSGFFVVQKVENYERAHINKEILSDARFLIDALSPLDLSDLNASADESVYPKYREIHNRMNQLSDLSSFVKTLYLVSFKEGQPLFVVGSLPQVFPHNVVPSFGSRLPQKAISDALNSKQPTLAPPYRDAGGRQAFSIFVPLVDKNGQVNSLLGIDLDSQQLHRQTSKVRLYTIIMIIVFLVLLILSYAFLIIFALKGLELEVQKSNLDKALRHLKEAESELAKSEETFRGILNNSPNAIFGFDADLRLIFWNEGAERLYGYHKDEVVNEKNPLLSKRIIDLFGIQSMTPEIDRVFQGSTFWHEGVHKTKTASVDVSMTVFPVKDPQGHILFGMGLSQDISMHKKFEAQLANANVQLESVLNGATHVSIMAADLNGIITVYNTGSERIFGYSPQEVLGKSVSILFPAAPEIKKFEEEVSREFGRSINGFEAMFEYARQGKVFEKEWTFVKKDGTPVPVEVTITPQRNEKGELIGFVGIGVDRTQRHEAQKALLFSQQKYKDLADNLNVGVYRNTPGDEGYFLEVNPAIVAMFEASSEEEFLSHRVSDLYQDAAKRKDFSNKILSQGYVKNEELELRTLKGRPFWGSVTAILKKDEKGASSFYGIIQDITEKKRILELLQYERVFSRNILNSMNDPLMVLDCQKLTILDVNRKFLEVSGFKKEDIIGKKYDQLKMYLFPVCPVCDCDEVVKEGKIVDKTYMQQDPLGKRIYVEVILSPLWDERGNIAGLIYISREVSDSKKLEEELKT
jgi:PAS domain S-box-containing protein